MRTLLLLALIIFGSVAAANTPAALGEALLGREAVPCEQLGGNSEEGTACFQRTGMADASLIDLINERVSTLAGEWSGEWASEDGMRYAGGIVAGEWLLIGFTADVVFVSTPVVTMDFENTPGWEYDEARDRWIWGGD